MAQPRLFLVAPDKPLTLLEACLTEACKAGDVASLLVPPSLASFLTSFAQKLGVAVMSSGEPHDAMRAGCDGLHLGPEDDVAEARKVLGKERFIGVYCGHSRHFAMEAAEAGADYVALAQNGPSLGGEPLVKWWVEVFEVPCVAFDPVDVPGLDTLLPQNPDFIRPADAMWDSPEAARRIVTDLTQRLKAT